MTIELGCVACVETVELVSPKRIVATTTSTTRATATAAFNLLLKEIKQDIKIVLVQPVVVKERVHLIDGRTCSRSVPEVIVAATKTITEPA